MGHSSLNNGILNAKKVTNNSFEHRIASLARFLFRGLGLNLNNFPAGIGPADGTNMVSQLRAMTLRAIIYTGQGNSEVTAPLTLTRLGIFPFG